MKFKVGDRVRVIREDIFWSYWMLEMSSLVGEVHTIVGECRLADKACPTLVVPGYNSGIISGMRERGEYGFPEHCLELAIQPGEQLLFAFMKEETHDEI